jgi:triosephosphate isomerase
MKKYVIGNWKSNKGYTDATNWVGQFNDSIITIPSEEVVMAVAPSFYVVDAVMQKRKEYPKLANLEIAVQDISPFNAGSYTGAVAAGNLGLGVGYAIVGHSERRRYFHETHQDVANKIARCVEVNITPIVCVDDEYISDQAAAIDAAHLSQCIVAYEELGAIGTGENESAEHVAEVVARIKKVFGEVPVLYGGSVKPGNADQYVDICDGVLVGGASLEAAQFAQIVSTFTLYTR